MARRNSRLPRPGKEKSIVLEGEATRRTAASDVSKGRLSAILANVADMVVTIDESGRIQSINPAAVRVFGYTAEEVIGKNVSMLASEPDKSRHDVYLRDYSTNGRAKIIGHSGYDVTATRKDGSCFPIELTVSETNIDGNRVFIGAMRDITERRALEAAFAQGEKLEAVGRLTGGLAHDFNNLLAVVIGNLDLLEAQLPKDSMPSQLAKSARDASLRGAALVRQLLAFSRRQQLQAIPLDLNQVVHDVSDLLKHALGEKITIKLALTEHLDLVLTDRAQLESAIVSLAVNAREAMPSGGTLTVETGLVHLDHKYAKVNPEVSVGDYAMLSLSDTGAGMTHDVLEKVFEPFFTTKAERRGSGLGLSVVYGFVKQSNGHIKIYSEPGYGTTVKLFLPFSDRGGNKHKCSNEISSLVNGTKTILLVEDRDDVRQVTLDQLTALGYQVIEARNAMEALGFLEGGARPDLLLTDVVMPGGMDGYELAAMAVRRWPALKILCTSGYTDAAMNRSHDHAFPFLSKPYRMSDLAARLHQALGQC